MTHDSYNTNIIIYIIRLKTVWDNNFNFNKWWTSFRNARLGKSVFNVLYSTRFPLQIGNGKLQLDKNAIWRIITDHTSLYRVLRHTLIFFTCMQIFNHKTCSITLYSGFRLNWHTPQDTHTIICFYLNWFLQWNTHSAVVGFLVGLLYCLISCLQ